MTATSNLDLRSTERSSLDGDARQPSQHKLVTATYRPYNPGEELHVEVPELSQVPPTTQKNMTSKGVRRMSSVPELRESHRNADYSLQHQHRQRSSSNQKAHDFASPGIYRTPEIEQGRSRLIRQKSVERGIIGLQNRQSPHSNRILSNSTERKPGSRPTSRNGGSVSATNGRTPAMGLKMPLAFNSLAKERGFTTGYQPVSQPHPTGVRSQLIAQPASLPAAHTGSGHAAISSASIPDVFSTNDNRLCHPRPQHRELPRSHPYQNSHPPQTTYSAVNSTNTSPHSSFGPPSFSDDIQTSFRSAISGSEINRSSGLTSASETATASSNAMTVDEAIGMYASDTDEDDILGTDSERPQSYGDSFSGGVSTQGSYPEDSGYRSKGDSVLGGEVVFDIKYRKMDNESSVEEESDEQREKKIIPRNLEFDTVQVQSSLHKNSPLSENIPTVLSTENVSPLREDKKPLPPPDGSYEAGYPNSAIQEPLMDSSGPDPKSARDRYGFRKQTQNITLEEYEEWEQRYEETLDRRRKKWEELLRDSGLTPGKDGPVRFPPKSNKIKRYVRKGIPPEWRGAAWFWYAGGQRFLTRHPGLYEELVEKGPAAPDAELIERDLHRTFPDNIKFKPDPPNGQSQLSKQEKQSETPMVHRLRRVLGAFALHVPRIGYCQSLNFLAGLLLLFMPEEKAFWMLYILTQVHLPGTHEVNLEGSSVDQWVLMMSVHETLPQVWAKIGGGLDGIEVDLHTTKLPAVTLCTSSWFMSGFIGSLPIESVLRVWDCLFYEGSKTLFRIAMTIFKIGEVQIKAVNDPMEIFQVVQTIPRKLADAGALIEACYRRRNGFGHLSQETIDQRRQLRRNVFAEERATAARGQLRVSKDDAALRGNISPSPRIINQAGNNHGELGRKFRKILVKT